jgi:AIPR protein
MASETLKLKAREELIRLYSADDSFSNFNSLNDKQKSVQLTRFYIDEIHNKQKTEISEDEIDQGLVDGANDLGCDFINRNDGRVTIIQSKYRNKSSVQEDVREISHFKSILKRFKNPNLKSNRNLKDIIDDIDWHRDSFELVFVTTGTLKDISQAKLVSDGPGDYPLDVDDLDERCEWFFYDEEELNQLLRTARDIHKGISKETVKLYPVGEKGRRGASSVIEATAGDYASYIMTLDARQINKAYQALGTDAIFSLNIRNYIGNTSTNKNIIDSAEKDPAQFFIYNNGISCLATNVALHEESIEVTGLQVINGAQTVKALVHVAKSIERNRLPYWSKSVPQVLVRITEIPEGYGPTQRTREKITQYNNTQNTVKISDFRSNDSVQKNLRDQFSELTRGGKKVVYLAKRTDKYPANSELVKFEEFAKSVYTFLYEFVSFSGSSSFLFNEGGEGGYVRVFGTNDILWERMPDDEFRLRAAIYWISNEISGYLRSTRPDEQDVDARAAIERKWALLYSFGVVVQVVYKDKWKNEVSKLYKGDWTIGEGKKGEAVSAIYNVAKAGVIMAYKNAKEHDPAFVHRNFMRARNTPDKIKEILTHTILPLMGKSIPTIGN